MGAPTQVTYAENQDIGTPGQLANGEDFNAFSRTVESVAGVPFGVPVGKGAADRGCIALAGADKAIGITRRNPAVLPGSGDKYGQFTEASVVDRGVMFARTETIVDDRAQAFFNVTTGKWNAGPAAANVTLSIAGVIYDTSAAANGIVALRIAIPAV